MMAGVCTGLGRYIGVHPTLVRAMFIVLAFAGGAGIVMYAVTWLIVPVEDAAEGILPSRASNIDVSYLIAGGFMIELGSVLLMRRVFPSLDGAFWPSIAVAIGVVLLVGAARSTE